MNNRGNQFQRLEGWRIKVLYFLIIAIFGYYAIRLFNLQILQSNTYLGQSEENRTKDISVPTQRGIIFDRNGVVLARNVASYNVIITPANLPGDPTEEPLLGSVEEIYRELSPLINIPVSNGILNDETVKLFTPCQTDFGIKEIVIIADTNAPYTPVRVACDVDKDIAMRISEKASDWPGVEIDCLGYS